MRKRAAISVSRTRTAPIGKWPRQAVKRNKGCCWRARKVTTGGENERLREHRIGDFRFKARSWRDARGNTSLVGAFLRWHYCVYILAFINEYSCALCNARRRGARKADFASRC